jgi:hypothetical protein
MWVASIHSNAYPVRTDEWDPRPSFDGVARCDGKKVWEVELIAHELPRIFAGERFVFGGDLNSGLLLDTNYRRQSNAKLFANLASAGFKDLRPRFHAAEQQTYFKERNGPYQLDHVFADAGTEALTTGWRVLTDVALEAKLSDHAPIEVVLASPGELTAGATSRASLGSDLS